MTTGTHTHRRALLSVPMDGNLSDFPQPYEIGAITFFFFKTHFIDEDAEAEAWCLARAEKV